MKTAKEWAAEYCKCNSTFKERGLHEQGCQVDEIAALAEKIYQHMTSATDAMPDKPAKKSKK